MKGKKIFTIGIGGSGLSGLARLLSQMGNAVSGSDASISPEKKKKLEKHHLKVFTSHDAKHITKDIQEVIYSQAIPQDNPELAEAHKKGIACLTYPQAIGKYLSSKTKICIAGTHGKTTTTAMIAAILLLAGKDPTVIVGAEVRELGNKNEHYGKSNLAVIETCEYRKSFHDIPPDILVITNIDFDHIDFYKNKKNYDQAFEDYIRMVPKNGAIIYLKGDKTAEKLIKKINHPHVTTISPSKIPLKIPGIHNQKNASLALALADYLKVPHAKSLEALSEFSGTKRRLEYKGTYKKVKIYDDYGHHPTEIKATLEAIRELYPKGKILTIFQPHQYSRTKAFLKDFATAFKQTDTVIIPNIYSARDTAADKASISVEKLIHVINTTKKTKTISNKAINGTSLEKTLTYCKKNALQFDAIITMGAGDIYTISDKLTQWSKK